MVTLPNQNGHEPPADDPMSVIPIEKAATALARHLHHLGLDAVGIEVDDIGNLVSICTDPELDYTPGAYYLLLGQYQLPPPIATRALLRSDLAEVRHFQENVDLVLDSASMEDKNYSVFKYNPDSVVALWSEIRTLLCIVFAPFCPFLPVSCLAPKIFILAPKLLMGK